MALRKTHFRDVTRLDGAETDAIAEYTFHPGYPERGPTYDCGGTPAEPPEVEIVLVTAGGVKIEPTDAEIEAWTTEIMENHEPDAGPDPDDERDRRMERDLERGL
jgi:hypothetical protein